jgi:threonine/homoserine/homoserine lactone efflux protein
MPGALVICVVALAFAFLGSMPLAGPIAVLTLSRAASGRYAEALRIALGAAVAEGIYAGLAFWGFATFLPHHGLVAPISQGATSILLVALGVRFVFWRPPAEGVDARESKAGTAFLGFSISALNPTLLLTWTAVVAFLYSRGLDQPSGIVAIPFGASAAVGVAGWFSCLVKLLQVFKSKLPVRAFRWVIRTMGVALVAIGIVTGVRLVQWIAVSNHHERSLSGCPARNGLSAAVFPFSRAGRRR